MGDVAFDIGITSTDTEPVFVHALVDYLTSLDSRITCANNIDDEYDETKWEEGNSHVPRFNIYFNNDYWFTIFRDAPFNTSCLAFRTCYEKEYNKFLARSQYFSSEWRRGQYSEKMTRTFHFSHIITNKFIMLGTAGTQNYKDSANFVITFSEGQKYTSRYGFGGNQYTKANIFNIAAQSFLNPQNEPATFISRFPYKAKPGTIDYVRSSIFANGGNKLFTLNNLCDCTTVNVCDSVSLSDGSYYAIGTNLLVKVLDN